MAETGNTFLTTSVVTVDLPWDGTDLEEEPGPKCRQRVYLRIDVEHMPLVGSMVLTLQLLKTLSQEKCVTNGMVIAVIGPMTSRSLTVDSFTCTS